jgi:predicted RNA-binding Zn-ribbon protein involved in translation (DUF1610 family)
VKEASVLVTCDTCGDRSVTRSAITLLLSQDGQHAFGFRCPHCTAIVFRKCELADAQRLNDIGIPTTHVHVGEGSADRAPLNMSDLVRFNRLLESEDHLVRLISSFP